MSESKHYEDGFTTTNHKDGGRGQTAIINQQEGLATTPEILANDVKRIVKNKTETDIEWVQDVKELIVKEGNNITIGGTTEVENLYIQGDVVDSNKNTALEVGTSDISISKNVNIGNTGSTKDLYVSGTINANKVMGNEIVENMSGYAFNLPTATTGITLNFSYVGVSKTGKKLTIVLAGNLTKTDNDANSFSFGIGDIDIPSNIGALLYPYSLSPFDNILANVSCQCWSDYNVNNKKDISVLFRKYANNYINITGYAAPLTLNTTYIFRIEQTFLLSDNLIS